MLERVFKDCTIYNELLSNLFYYMATIEEKKAFVIANNAIFEDPTVRKRCSYYMSLQNLPIVFDTQNTATINVLYWFLQNHIAKGLPT